MNRVHINILFFLSLIMLALMTFFVTSAQAASGHSAPTAVTAATAGPAATSGGLFTGTFKGVMLGDDDSRAPVTLELMQDGRAVTGAIVVGRGLLIDGGNCGLVEVPVTTQIATGTTTARAPRMLSAETGMKVQGLAITIELDGQLSRGGKTITAEARIDLPWLCGRDPVITGEFDRTE